MLIGIDFQFICYEIFNNYSLKRPFDPGIIVLITLYFIIKFYVLKIFFVMIKFYYFLELTYYERNTINLLIDKK